MQKKMPMRQHEQIAVFYKRLPTYNPQFRKGKPLHSRGKKYNGVANNNYGDYKKLGDERVGSTDKYPTSIVSMQKPHPSKSKHRTEKPVELLEYLIRTFTNADNTVLDNCMGSGSTAVACINSNRKFIGFEIDSEIFETAKQRITKEVSKLQASRKSLV